MTKMACGWPRSNSWDIVISQSNGLKMLIGTATIVPLNSPRAGYVININLSVTAIQRIDSHRICDHNPSPVYSEPPEDRITAKLLLEDGLMVILLT